MKSTPYNKTDRDHGVSLELGLSTGLHLIMAVRCFEFPSLSATAPMQWSVFPQKHLGPSSSSYPFGTMHLSVMSAERCTQTRRVNAHAALETLDGVRLRCTAV